MWVVKSARNYDMKTSFGWKETKSTRQTSVLESSSSSMSGRSACEEDTTLLSWFVVEVSDDVPSGPGCVLLELHRHGEMRSLRGSLSGLLHARRVAGPNVGLGAEKRAETARWQRGGSSAHSRGQVEECWNAEKKRGEAESRWKG